MKLFHFTILLIALICNGMSAQCDDYTPINLNTQMQIDSFSVDYPGCTEVFDLIIGDLSQPSNDISNLNGLNVLESIYALRVINTTNLSSLQGLNNVDTFRVLYVENNTSLTSFTGLADSVVIKGSLSIDNNSAITNLAGLENIVELVGELAIVNNTALESISALANLRYVRELTIKSNGILTNLQGLNNIDSIYEAVSIRGNPALSSLDGLNALRRVVDDGLSISNNDVLTDLTGLSSLDKSDVYINENDNLSSLEGLNSATTLYYLGITDNDNLLSLDGLENITGIGRLVIRDNELLNNMDGIADATIALSGSIDGIDINNNPSLAVCHVESVCNYLNGPPGWMDNIGNNLPGCNSIAEVTAACLTDIEETPVPSISIYPNPVYNTVKIEAETEGIYKIMNTQGQILQYGLLTGHTTIDMSHFSEGLYFVVLTGVDGRKTTNPLVKIRP